MAASTTHVLETSEDLQNWQESPVDSIQTQPIDENTDRLEISPDAGNPPAPETRFYRIRVTE